MSQFHQAPNVYVGKVNIKVEDLDRSIAFYESIIGLQLLSKTKEQALLTADGVTPLVVLERPAEVIPLAGRYSGLYHFALLLPERGDLAVFLRHLIQTGYPFGAGDHYVSEALYITDPDGNGIEVYWDRPSSEWKWDKGIVEMATLQIDAQGILAESDAPWGVLPKGTIMGHIHLHVGDVKQAEQFYNEGLGFKTVAYYPQAAFMSTGGYHHHIAINTWQGVGAPTPPLNMVGLSGYTLVYPNEVVRQNAIAHLEQSGIKVTEELDSYSVKDPSGNRIWLVI
jgi:catechol 2,3-dioxygenase